MQIHLWLGLTLGIVGALLGVTGSVLVYDQAIDGWLNPERYRVTGEGVSLPYVDYARRAEAVVGGGARTLNLRLPDDAGTPVIAFVRARGEGNALAGCIWILRQAESSTRPRAAGSSAGRTICTGRFRCASTEAATSSASSASRC